MLAGHDAANEQHLGHKRLAPGGGGHIYKVGAITAALQRCSLPGVHLLDARPGIGLRLRVLNCSDGLNEADNCLAYNTALAQ